MLNRFVHYKEDVLFEKVLRRCNKCAYARIGQGVIFLKKLANLIGRWKIWLAQLAVQLAPGLARIAVQAARVEIVEEAARGRQRGDDQAGANDDRRPFWYAAHNSAGHGAAGNSDCNLFFYILF